MNYIEITKWFFRFAILEIAAIASGYMFYTWQWDAIYYVCALTNLTIFTHAIGMIFEWWNK